jgi:hypothetical protein
MLKAVPSATTAWTGRISDCMTQVREVQKIAVTATKVDAQAKGYRARKRFKDLVVKFGVVGDRIVPKLPPKFQGRVTVASLSTYDNLYKQLERYGVGGWTRGDKHNTDQLRALLLPVAGVEEEAVLTGRGNETRIVQYLKPLPDAVHAPRSDNVSDATDAEMFAAGGGTDADVDTSSSEEEEAPRRSSRSCRAPSRPNV